MNPVWFLTAVVAGGVAVTTGFALTRARGRIRSVQARLGPVTRGDDLEGTSAGASVTLAGLLDVEQPIVSYHPYGASLMDEAHVYAKTGAVGRAGLRIGRHRVALAAPLQIVLGESETGRRCDAARAARLLGAPDVAAMTDATCGQFRILRPGTAIFARGALSFGAEPPTEAGYRQSTRTFELRPIPDPTWPERPISLVANKPRGRRLRTAFAVAATISAAAAAAGSLEVELGRGVGSFGRGGRPSCAFSIEADLAANDVERAAAKVSRCDDPLARATVAWAQAEFSEAARAFEAARRADPGKAPSISEIQSYALAGSEHTAREASTRLANARYPGPTTPEKARLECVAAGFAQAPETGRPSRRS
jgi:hypothetical protein